MNTRTFLQGKRIYFLSAILTSLVLVLGLWSYTRATGNAITACVAKSGEVHILLRDNTACHNNETLLSWNITGQQGPKGDTGATGATGSQGVQGVAGPQGTKGDIGQTGSRGPQGPKGDAGTSLKLYDANGQFLGILLGMPPSDFANNKYQTYLPDAKITLRLNERLGLVNDGIHIYFLTTDCTGTPYALDPPLYPFGYGRVGSHFYKSINAAASTLSLLSRYEGGLCVVGDGGLQGGVTEVSEIPAPFTLPLAWPPNIQ